MKKVFTAMLLFMMTASASAAPSINGSTGLIETPASDVVREGDLSLGYYHLEHGTDANLSIGIAKNIEVGLSSYDPDNGSRMNRLNAKWSLAPETVMTPGLAAGIEDLGNEGERSAYLVGSKALPMGFRIHCGIGNGRYDRIFGGIEKTINPIGVLTGKDAFPATTLIAEYDGEDMNVGARLSLVPGIKINAGWQDMKDFYVGFSITK